MKPAPTDFLSPIFYLLKKLNFYILKNQPYIFFASLQKQLFSILKKIITYCLLILFSFAYSYETIKYFSKVFDGASIAWIDNFDCEEKESESEKGNEKNEKLNFAEDFYLNHKHFNNTLIAGQLELKSLSSKQSIDFSSSDFSQKVFSPPEML